MSDNHRKLTTDVVIIGAGASGLFCAMEALKRHRRVVIIEQSNKPGRKILMSGGGKCNFTNLHCQPEAFLSQNPHFCRSALKRYSQSDFINLVKKHRIPFHEKTLGQLFCDDSAKDIVNMLLTEASGASFQYKTQVTEISYQEDRQRRFTITTQTQQIQCESLVIASGGLTVPTMGSSPLAYRVAEQFDVAVHPTRAALVPLTLHQKDKERFSELSGVSVPCVAAYGKREFKENLLFTHRGLSGPAILQISSYWQPGKPLHLDLQPDDSLSDILKGAKLRRPQQQISSVLQQHLPKRLLRVLFNPGELEQPLANTANQQLEQIAESLHHWVVHPNGTEGYRTAEVTLGGVCTDHLSQQTMAVKTVPQLFFIGEAMDVTGWLGGYNFQWAWSSAFAAGQAC